MTMPLAITAFYAFKDLPQTELSGLQTQLKDFGATKGMRGLVLLAEEGINGTVSGSAEVITEWKTLIETHFGAVTFKDSSAEGEVFRRWFVKIRKEIVSLKSPGVRPAGKHKHLSPEEWQKTLEQEDVVVLDARNDYEVAIGKFTNAVDPQIKSFHEFPKYVAQAKIPKDKKVLMYCTGGIRCEKALLEMEKQGYDNVYQLDGGILAYLQKFPQKNFEGECFVFDHRVAVNQELKPSSNYHLCPHCGDPADQLVNCECCGKRAKICMSCKQKSREMLSCSKNCRHHVSRKLTAVA